MASIRNMAVAACIVVGGLAVGTITLAAKHAPAGEFKQMDVNKDGKVSADEHAAAARKMFLAMDVDKDGKVTAAEMDAANAGRKAAPGDLSSAEKIKAIDTDGDGILSAEEHAIGARTMFDKMDANKDGYLSQFELNTGHAALLKKPAS